MALYEEEMMRLLVVKLRGMRGLCKQKLVVVKRLCVEQARKQRADVSDRG